MSVLTIALVITLLPMFSTNVSAADAEVNGTITGGGRLSGVVVTATPVAPLIGDPVTDTSDTNGEFTLLLPAGTYAFTFEKAGFRVSDSFGMLTDNKLTVAGTEGTITLNIVMEEAFGGITGYVKNTRGDGLGDARVYVMSGDTVVSQTITDGKGFYLFDKSGSNKILTGIYSVKVVRSDHGEQIKDNIEVVEGVNKTVNFTLESLEDSYLFGLDLPHSLMVGGFITGLIVIIAVAVYRRRLGRRLLGSKDDINDEDDSYNE